LDTPVVPLPTNCIPEEYIYLESCRCPACGAVGYALVKRGVSTRATGALWDEMNARCSTCGAERTFWFDVSQCLGKTYPEEPSQLFDLLEWTLMLFHLDHLPPTGNERTDRIIQTRSLVAVEQMLLFFDAGVETPRADAYFHTPGGPPLRIQAYLSRRLLEPMQRRKRADMGWSPGASGSA
jgi:hypothetical protein